MAAVKKVCVHADEGKCGSLCFYWSSEDEDISESRTH